MRDLGACVDDDVHSPRLIYSRALFLDDAMAHYNSIAKNNRARRGLHGQHDPRRQLQKGREDDEVDKKKHAPLGVF